MLYINVLFGTWIELGQLAETWRGAAGHSKDPDLVNAVTNSPCCVLSMVLNILGLLRYRLHVASFLGTIEEQYD